MYREVQILLCFSTFQEAGSTITMAFLDVDYDDDSSPIEAWVYGSLVGVLLVAIFSDFVFKSKLLFLPITCFVILQICIQIGLLVADIFNQDFARDSKYLLFTEGFVESCM